MQLWGQLDQADSSEVFQSLCGHDPGAKALGCLAWPFRDVVPVSFLLGGSGKGVKDSAFLVMRLSENTLLWQALWGLSSSLGSFRRAQGQDTAGWTFALKELGNLWRF